MSEAQRARTAVAEWLADAAGASFATSEVDVNGAFSEFTVVDGAGYSFTVTVR